VLKGSASGDWWSLGTYAQVAGMKEDTFTPVSYDVHGGSTGGLGLQKYDFGQFYASKTFHDPAKKRQILWGWVAEEGGAPHKGEAWSSIQILPRSVELDPTNTTRLVFPPIPELEALRGEPISIALTAVAANAPQAALSAIGATIADHFEIELNVTADFTKPGVSAGVCVLGGAKCAGGQIVTIGSLPAAANPEGIILLTLNLAGKKGQSVIGPVSSTVSLRVFVDKSSIEAYAAGGRAVASHRVYPTAARRTVSFVNNGKVNVTIAATAWPMAVATRPSAEELLEGLD